MKRLLLVPLAALLLGTDPVTAARPTLDWRGYGRDPQHTAVATVAAQRPLRIRWQTPVDLAPQYWGDLLLIHYGSPSRRGGTPSSSP